MTMRPRLPRNPDEWVTADCAAVRELARSYVPTLAFSEDEEFFPILAESWLSHSAYGQWPTDATNGMSHLLPTDTANRGTALVDATTAGDSLTVNRIAGAPNPAGRPLQFSTDSNDPNAIGRPDRRGAEGADLSLVFGGWANADRTAGDEAYLASTFSEFAGAMNPTDAAEWDAPARSTWPTMWVPQPPTPTVYAEIDWTGRFPDLDEAAELGDFAPGANGQDNDRLDGYLQVTYHYLFPMRRPSKSGGPEAGGVARSESQWQAATVVFEARRPDDSQLNDEGRPEELQFREPPVAVILSHQLDAETKADVVAWDDEILERFEIENSETGTEYASTSPVIYVGEGTHTFLPEPTSGENPYTGGTGADDGSGDGGGSSADDIGTDDFQDEGGVGGFFLALLVILLALLVLWGLIAGAYYLFTIAAGILAALAVAAIVVLAVIALLILIAGLAWLEDWFDSGGKSPHRRSSNEEATGDGSAAAPPPTETDGSRGPPSDSSDSGGAPGSGGHDDPTREGSDVDAGGYASGTGGQRGHNQASFDVRVVDRVNTHAATGFPPEPTDCERPTWWGYTGTWGAPVSVREEDRWTWGPQRVDEHGRSWSYWHAVVFDQYLSRD